MFSKIALQIQVIGFVFVATACGKESESLRGTVPIDFDSHLPLVVVEAEDKITKEKVMGLIKVYDRESNNIVTDEPTFEHLIEIKVRGHSSSAFAKKQFGFEFKDEEGEDAEAEILGLPKHEDWILHAPYSDKTLMRNHVAYTIWEEMGHYAVRRKYVEVFVKEGDRPINYRGIYLVWEKIRKGDDRLDVGKASKDREKDPYDVGGFIISRDKVDPDDLTFEGVDGAAIQFTYPKDKKIEPNQIANIKMYYDAFVTAIEGGDVEQIEEYADVDSFVDHALLKDYSSDPDAYWASTYFHRRKKEVMKAGPVWDFNIAFGNHPERWRLSNNPRRHLSFWKPLLKIPEVEDRYKTRWDDLRSSTFSDERLHGLVDDTVDHLGEAVNRNFTRWDILGKRVSFNPEYNPKYYSGEITLFKDWLARRSAYFDDL